jgi:hypothetical protein
VAWSLFAIGFFFEAMPLFSRGYLFPQGAVAKNSGFNRLQGDSQGLWGVNPKFLATASCGGIFLEISPFEKAHALTLSMRELVEKI